MKDLSLHILDIAENSIAAGAQTIRIIIEELPNQDVYQLVIEDDGKGMEPDFVAKVTDPWVTTRTTRRIGMGLPLLQQNCELAGGSMVIDSQPGKGTSVIAEFRLSHMDRPPAGDIPATLRLLIAANPTLHLVYEHHTPKGTFVFDTRQVKEAIGDLPLNHPEVLRMCSTYVYENLNLIGAEYQTKNDFKLAENDLNHL
jgi:anti-sigma regulatory factor (Ser/Thr protein kinase)